MKKTWQVVKSDHYLRDTSADIAMLTKGVYNLMQTERGELYLQKMSEDFSFDFKVYGLEETFINRVLKTYKETKGNMGLLLNGVKGTGENILLF